MRIRGLPARLLAVSLGIVAVAVLVISLVLGPSLRALLMDRLESELLREARATAEAINAAGTPFPPAKVDSLAKLYGRLFEARVTIIAPDGVVLGESDLPLDDVARMENHADRPEIIAAKNGAVGISTRVSRTSGRRMLYVAVRYGGSGTGGFARAALPVAQVEAEIGRQRRLLWLASLASLVVAAAAGMVAARLLSRRLRALTAAARALKRRDFTQRLIVRGDDDFAELADALDTLAKDLEMSLWALNRERDLLGAVLDAMTDGLLVVDRAGIIVRTNPAFRVLFGVSDHYPPGTPVDALRHPDLVRILRAALAGNGPVSMEIELALPAPRSVVAAASLLERGGEVGLVAVFHDVTELRRLERVRRDFIANASHELRTPIAAIQGYAETLLDGALADASLSKEFVEATHRHASRMGRLIADLLDLSRIESGEERPREVEFSIEEALTPALDAVAETVRVRRQALEVAPGTGSLRVCGDPRATEQILTNLLDNAAKYTPPGGRILVSAMPGPGYIRVSVRDTGPGIHPEHRERIFERFYRIDPGRSRDLGGTGLGLAIVRHLVEAMSGSVGVDSAPGGGSIFWFTLPVVR